MTEIAEIITIDEMIGAAEAPAVEVITIVVEMVEIGTGMIGAHMTTVVIIVVMVSVEAVTITIVTAAAVSTTTIAMTAIEDQALIGMIAEVIGIAAMEVIEIAAMEVTEIITEITEIITIAEMTVEVTKGMVHQFGILAMTP